MLLEAALIGLQVADANKKPRLSFSGWSGFKNLEINAPVTGGCLSQDNFLKGQAELFKS